MKLKVIFVDWLTRSIYFKYGNKKFFYKRYHKPLLVNFEYEGEDITVSAATSSSKEKYAVGIQASNVMPMDKGFIIVNFRNRKIE